MYNFITYLNFNPCKDQDTGLYHCEAVNIAGKEKKTFRLIVQTIPVISGQPIIDIEHGL